jgi:hypothetical protein
MGWRYTGILQVACAALLSTSSIVLAEAVEEPPYGLPEKPVARSLFLSTFLPTIGAGVAQALINWFEKRYLSPDGTISEAEGIGASQRDDPLPATAAGVPVRVGSPEYAGIAYEVYAGTQSGTWRRVDPLRHTFRTGDRFTVAYRPNLPGHISVFNVNPRGEETLLETLDVAGGQLLQLGPYEFAGTIGRDVLRIELTPCRPLETRGVRRRDIVKVGQLTVVPSNMADCSERGESLAQARSLRLKKRDIVRVQAEGGIAYAVDRIGREEGNSGVYDTRTVEIVFQHR